MAEVLGTLEYRITADFSDLQRKFEQFGNKISANSNGGGKGTLKVGLDLSKAERQLAEFDRKLARTRVIRIDADVSAAEQKINRLLSKVGNINVGGGGSAGSSALAGLLGGVAAGAFANRGGGGAPASSIPNRIASGIPAGNLFRSPLPHKSGNIFPPFGDMSGNPFIRSRSSAAGNSFAGGSVWQPEIGGVRVGAASYSTSGAAHRELFPPTLGGFGGRNRALEALSDAGISAARLSSGSPYSINMRPKGFVRIPGRSIPDPSGAGFFSGYGAGGGGGGGLSMSDMFGSPSGSHGTYRGRRMQNPSNVSAGRGFISGANSLAMLGGVGTAAGGIGALYNTTQALGNANNAMNLAGRYGGGTTGDVAAYIGANDTGITGAIGGFNGFFGTNIRAFGAGQIADAKETMAKTQQQEQRNAISNAKSAARTSLNKGMESMQFGISSQTTQLKDVSGGMSGARAGAASQIRQMNEDIRKMNEAYNDIGDTTGEGKKRIAAATKAAQDYASEVYKQIQAQELLDQMNHSAGRSTARKRLSGDIRGADRQSIEASFDSQITATTSSVDKQRILENKADALAQHDKDVATDSGNFIRSNNVSANTARINRQNLYSDNPNAAGAKYALEQSRDEAVSMARQQGRGPAEINAIMANFAAQLDLLAAETEKTAKDLARTRNVELMGIAGNIKVNNLQANFKPHLAEAQRIKNRLDTNLAANEGITNVAHRNKLNKAQMSEANSELGLQLMQMQTGGSVQSIGGYAGPKSYSNPESDKNEAIKQIQQDMALLTKKILAMP